MNVLEDPPLRNMDVPRGAVVILSLDPVASVADLEDDLSTAAAAKLPRGKYLAIVRGHEHDNTRLLYDQPLRFGFFTGGRGLPEPPYASFSLCPDAVHPRGRPPLLPTPPLPWPDCFVHLFCGLTSIVTRVHFAASGTVWSVPGSEMRTLLSAKWEDLATQGRENPREPEEDDRTESGSHSSSGTSSDSLDGRTASGGRSRRSSVHSLERSREGTASARSRHSAHDSSGSHAKPAKSGPHSQHSASGSSAGAASGSRSPHSLGSVASSDSSIKWVVPPMLRFRAEIWLDLTSVDDLDPPQELEDVLTALETLEEDWKGRMRLKELADQPRTSQWAEDVAAASVEDVTIDLPPDEGDNIQETAVTDPPGPPQGLTEGDRDVTSPVVQDQPPLLSHAPASPAVPLPGGEHAPTPPEPTVAAPAPEIPQAVPTATPSPVAPGAAHRKSKGLLRFGSAKWNKRVRTALRPALVPFRKLGALFSRQV